MQKRTHWVATHVLDVAQNHIAHGATLYADVLLFYYLNELGVKSQTETMTNALGSEENRVVKILVFATNTFTG